MRGQPKLLNVPQFAHGNKLQPNDTQLQLHRKYHATYDQHTQIRLHANFLKAQIKATSSQVNN